MDVRNDEPVASIVNDLFGFSYQASIIAKLVGGKDSKNHLSVGVSGSWGSGKTSLLNMVKELLEYKKHEEKFDKLGKNLSRNKIRNVAILRKMVPFYRLKKEVQKKDYLKAATEKLQDVKVIWFDPWFFGSEETIIKAFFYRIAKELASEDKELSKLILKLAVVMTKSPDLPDSFPVVGNAFKAINYSRNLISWMSGDDGSVMDFTDIKRRICDRLKNQEFTFLDDEDELIRTKRKRIVIIIDDLDRLQVDEALTMLKVIRLVTELGANFVIGYDEETLSATIDNNCGGHGREYIRKMINIPVKINNIDKYDLLKVITFNLWNEKMSALIINELHCYDTNEIFRVMEEVINSIRLTKIIINTYRTGYHIMKEYVDPIDYLGLCLIHLLYPECYKAIREFRNLSDYHLLIHDSSTLGDNGRDMQYELLLLKKDIFENKNESRQDLVKNRNDFLSRILSEMFYVENISNDDIKHMLEVKNRNSLLPEERKITFIMNHKYYFSIFQEYTDVTILPNMLP